MLDAYYTDGINSVIIMGDKKVNLQEFAKQCKDAGLRPLEYKNAIEHKVSTDQLTQINIDYR
jgi:hypothetical protein